MPGTYSLGISDHSLIYLVRKSNYHVSNTNFPVTKRQFKKSDNEESLTQMQKISVD